MKVLMVEPGKSPYAAEIESGLKSLQAAVGGDIQAVYPYEDPVALICNEEGKLMGLPLNRALFDDDGHIYDIVSGNFLIVGLGEENFTDLSPDLMEKYGEQFKYPEKFATAFITIVLTFLISVIILANKKKEPSTLTVTKKKKVVRKKGW